MNGWASNGTDVITATAAFKDLSYCCEPSRFRPLVPDDNDNDDQSEGRIGRDAPSSASEPLPKRHTQ